MKIWEAVPIIEGARTDAWCNETEFKEPPVIFTRAEIAAIDKALDESAEVVKHVSNIHDMDARDNGDDKYDHAHIPVLFREDCDPKKLQKIIFDATGKTIKEQFIQKSSLNYNPVTRSTSDTNKFAVLRCMQSTKIKMVPDVLMLTRTPHT